MALLPIIVVTVLVAKFQLSINCFETATMFSEDYFILNSSLLKSNCFGQSDFNLWYFSLIGSSNH